MVPTAKKTDKSVKLDKSVKADQPEQVVKTARVAKLDLTIKPVETVKTVKKDKMDMTNLKRLPKSLRTYQRRMKQTANQEGTTYRSLIARHPFYPKAGEAPLVPVDETPQIPAND